MTLLKISSGFLFTMKTERWKNFITGESSDSVDIERKKSVLYFFIYIGASIILFFAIRTPTEELTLKIVLFSAASLMYLNHIAFLFHKNITVTTTLMAMAVFGLVLSVVYTGGYANTGLYWTYPFPITFFVFFGPLRGVIINLSMFFSILLMLYQPHLIPADYRPEEIARFVPTFLVNITLCLIAEFFRSRSHTELSNINIDRLKLANTDSLTNLPNRRFIDSVFMDAAKNDQSSHFPMTIVAVDIDHFKKVNDTYGHDTGDMALKHVANLLRKNIREVDVVARIGGEEFLIIFPRTNKEVGIKISEKIRVMIEQTPYIDKDIKIPITISLGCTEVSKYVFIEEAIKQSDELLYKAKRSGRNRLEF